MDNTKQLKFKWKEHLEVLNRSPKTIKSYLMNVEGFIRASAVKDIRQVKRTTVEDYIANLYDYRSEDGEPYSVNTIKIKIRSIKRSFEYLEKANVIFIDPTESVSEPPEPDRIVKATLTPKEVNKILDQPNLGTHIGIRDRTIIEVMYDTGIRVNELCALTIYDADLTGKMLRITLGKGKKDRIVPLGKHAVKFLREYIRRIRPYLTKKNRSTRQLFVGYMGRSVSDQTVVILVRKYVKATKIKKRVTPHTFRHSFAAGLIKNGADIRAVQKMLGHVSIKTTQRYIRSLGIDLKTVHKKTHPREKDKVSQEVVKPEVDMIRGHYGQE